MRDTQKHSELDDILNKRVMPQTPPALAERIIHRAARMAQRERRVFWRIWLDESTEFMALPRPALALGLCLMIGIFSGWNAENGRDPETAESLDSLLIGEDWL